MSDGIGDRGGGEGLCSLFKTGQGGSPSLTTLSTAFLASARLALFDRQGQEWRLCWLQQIDEEGHKLEEAMHRQEDLDDKAHVHTMLLV